jgi:putative flippase GtrA
MSFADFKRNICNSICNRKFINEFLRFGIVGTIAFLIHYGIYLLTMRWINVIIAYTLGYAISFVCNFFLTSHFTFKRKASVKKGFGFVGAHLFNYFLHMIFLNLFLYVGVSEQLAPIPVLCIVVPVNFLVVRYVFKSNKL